MAHESCLLSADRVKRDSEAEADSEVYDNIYTAISEANPAARDKRQNAGRASKPQTQQNREGKTITDGISARTVFTKLLTVEKLGRTQLS